MAPVVSVGLALAALALAALGASGDRAAPAAGAAHPTPAVDGATQAAVSALVGKVDRAYWARDSGTGLRVVNREQRLKATFGANGPRLRTGGTSVGLELRALGRGDALRGVAGATPRARASRIEYRRGPVTEWYLNGPAGLEQGFTSARPPRARDR